MQGSLGRQHRGLFVEGLGVESRRIARRPHVEATPSCLAKPTRATAPPRTKASLQPAPLPNKIQKVRCC